MYDSGPEELHNNEKRGTDGKKHSLRELEANGRVTRLNFGKGFPLQRVCRSRGCVSGLLGERVALSCWRKEDNL